MSSNVKAEKAKPDKDDKSLLVTSHDRYVLAGEIEDAILALIAKLGYRNGPAISAASSAAKMVSSKVTERKKTAP